MLLDKSYWESGNINTLKGFASWMVVEHTFNPNTRNTEAGGSLWEFGASLVYRLFQDSQGGYTGKPCLKKTPKNKTKQNQQNRFTKQGQKTTQEISSKTRARVAPSSQPQEGVENHQSPPDHILVFAFSLRFVKSEARESGRPPCASTSFTPASSSGPVSLGSNCRLWLVTLTPVLCFSART